MKPLIAVIADDLTGVCDTGAQLASAGLQTMGSVDQEFKSENIPQVLLVNTQSRSLEDREGSLIIQQAVAGLRRYEPKWFFKKIDTALRGHIAIEVSSMMEALRINSALYVAAIPGAGRTTFNGRQFFRGVPIKQSIHGEDRLNPHSIPTSSNVEIFSGISGLETEVVSVEEVRSGNLDIAGRMKSPFKKVIIFDSETDEDIDQIVKASMKAEPSSFLYVGSLGLAGAIGRFLAKSLIIPERQEASFHEEHSPSSKKRVLVVSGSSHPMARSQISFVEDKRVAEVIRIQPEDLLKRLDHCILQVTETWEICLRRQKMAVITIGEGKSDAMKQGQDLVVALAKAISPIIHLNQLDGLVLIGGDTSYATCREVGIEKFEILGNISFVAAYGKPSGAGTNIKALVTKGGSLGEVDTLEKILDFIDGKA